MSDSNLSDFLRSVRRRRNISSLKAAHRAEMTIEEYRQIEATPEKTPGFILARVFKALEFSDQEFMEFQIIAGLELKERYEKPGAIRPPLHDINWTPENALNKEEGKEPTNVIEFEDKNGLNSRQGLTRRREDDNS